MNNDILNISPSLYRRVAQSNNNGVQFLLENKFVEGLQSFQEGLTKLRRLLLSEDEEEEQEQEDEEESELQQVVRTALFSTSLSEENPHGNAWGQYDDVFVLFDRALELPTKLDDIEEHPTFYKILLPVVLTYNVGLAHHKCGLHRGRSRILSKGLGFYSMAYTSLTDQLDTIELEKSTSVQLCLIAIVNNIGHVHAHFRRLTETATCSHEMSLRISESNQSAAADRSLATVYRTEYQVFFLNALLFRESELMTSPAA